MHGGGVVLFALAVTGAACTFGSLDSYAIQTCVAASSQSADLCDPINHGDTTTCKPWQCNAATGTCVQKVRDDDRDGDPPIACGGGDCDDENPALSSLKVVTPTTTGTVALNGANPTLSYDGVTPLIAFPAASGGTPCITFGNADPDTTSEAGGTESLSGCTALGPSSGAQSYGPVQPYAVSTNPGDAADVATAFIATSGCADGEVAVDFTGSSADLVAIDSTCAGAALPALAVSAQGAGVAAYYATSVHPFTIAASPLDVCGSEPAAALTLLAIDNIASPSFGKTTILTVAAVSVGPPAIAWVGSTVFVASPDASAATLWALDESFNPKATASLLSLTGAHIVSLGVNASGGTTTHLAVIAALGCSAQEIHTALVDYDGSSFKIVGDTTVSASSSGFKDAPSIAWAAPRSHWLATWAAAGPVVSGRFLDTSAKPSEAEFPIAQGAFGSLALANGHAALISTSGGGELQDSQVRCP